MMNTTSMYKSGAIRVARCVSQGLLAVGLWSGLCAEASASENFLPLVAADSDASNLNWPGGCDLCHADSVNAQPPASKPFAETLKSKGTITIRDQDSVIAALGEFTGEEDSDGDGVDDITELLNGTDPNDPNCKDPGCYSGYTGAPPEYGCVARVAPGAPRGVLPWLSALLVAAGLWRNRRRR